MANNPEDYQVFFGCSDFSGLFRGRAVSSTLYKSKLNTGCGWVPADQSLTPFGEIGSSNPFGSLGDLRLIPDQKAEYRIKCDEMISPLHFFLCDINNSDGAPWTCCARNYLKKGIKLLKERYGLSLKIGFEHEFTFIDEDLISEPVFSMRAFRKEEKFISILAQCLSHADIIAENFLPEYGVGQFEVPTSAKAALAAADDAVAFREITREVSRLTSRRVSFSPKVSPEAVGNGVHLHFSLLNDSGKNICEDKNQKGAMSKEFSAFCAGVLKHINSLTALGAPSSVSYLRLKPHNWAASYNTISLQDREAAIRICPEMRHNNRKISSFHGEIRLGDATASPYLHLGSIIQAGIIGLENSLEVTRFTESDPSEMTNKEKKKLGLKRLPRSLKDSISLLSSDENFMRSEDPLFWECYSDMRLTEYAHTKKLTEKELCQAYSAIF